jgi:small subunit ribosomal protein S17
MNTEAKKIRALEGKVVSDKMNKTVTVLIERSVKHALYGKYVSRSTKLHAHNENGAAMGDLVRIIPCRPMSKTKSWAVSEIVRKAS